MISVMGSFPEVTWGILLQEMEPAMILRVACMSMLSRQSYCSLHRIEALVSRAAMTWEKHLKNRI